MKTIATLRTSIQITDGMSPAFRAMNNALNIVISSFENLQDASHNTVDIKSLQAARTELNKTETYIDQVEKEIAQANSKQEQLNQSFRAGGDAAGGMVRKVMGMVGALAGAATVKMGADATDAYVNQNSRLAMINDGSRTQLELQNAIFQAAQRSKGEYSATVNTVAKLGLLAKDAFGSNDETIKFAELMNKSFKVSGSSIQEASNGMYQLTQALAAGKLQGDEFRSVMENAPMVAQAIATYTGKSMGELKKMSSEGEITADIIKNAMFAAADDINAKFETMPNTFGSVFTSMKNIAIMQFSETMQKINDYLNSVDGATMIQGLTNIMTTLIVVVGGLLDVLMQIGTFFITYWPIIEPIVWGLVFAFVAYNAVSLVTNGILMAQRALAWMAAQATAAQTGATFMATFATKGLNAALYASPIVWIIAIIVLLVIAFYAVIGAINKTAGTSISATGVIAGVFMVVVAFVSNLFAALGNLLIDVIALIWNNFASFGEFLANVFNDPVGSIVRLFSDMADSLLSVLQSIASAMDTLFGSNMSGAVQGWRDQLDQLTKDVVGEAEIQIPKLDASQMHLDRFEYGAAYEVGYDFGKGIEDKFDPSNMFGAANGATEGLDAMNQTAYNTGEMKDTMKATEEDLKYLRDVAEQEVINRFTTAEIKVEMPVSANISSTMDLDGVVAHLEKTVYDTMNAAAEGVSV